MLCVKRFAHKYWGIIEMVAGILTSKQRAFLEDYQQGRKYSDRERHYLSSIRRKTRKVLTDLSLVFEKLPQSYLLFSEVEEISYLKPIEKVATILFLKNYQVEYRKRMKDKTKRQIDIEIIKQKTRLQLRQFIESVLKTIELP